MPLAVPAGVVVRPPLGPSPASAERVLTAEALAFVADLERRFRNQRTELLARRAARQRDLDGGAIPGFLVETRAVRDRDWRVAPTPPALERRRVEITGPVDRKMMINALNSGADAFMADFEDATAPTWANLIEGQANVQDAVRGTLGFTGPDGRRYALNDERATLILRPRGWHLHEAHVHVDGAPMSASLFDFGLSFFHNAAEQLARGAGPYYYLPKLESRLEARLWNEVFVFAQERVGLPLGSVRATVLIETVLAAFEMDEILYELRDHVAGLNAGRWDYIFSVVKKFSGRADMVLPDRAQVTMTVPFMRAYTELLVRTCHRRGAHAMGGMAAFVPNRRDPVVTEAAVTRVREDKEREARDGFDGTWVAHPDLVPVAMGAFLAQLRDRPNQKERLRDDVHPDANALLRLDVPGGRVTDDGVRANIDVALQYIDAWLRGSGAVAIHNLMEDAATAEIARAQLWQWTRHHVPLGDGRTMTPERYAAIRDDVLASLDRERGDAPSRLHDATALLDELVLGRTFIDFLTIPAYAALEPNAPREGDVAGSDTDESRAGLDSGTESRTQPAATNVAPIFAGADGDDTLRLREAPSAIDRLRGSIRIQHTVATLGAQRLRASLASPSMVRAARMPSDGATPSAVDAIQVASTLARGLTDDLPARVRSASDALLRADRIDAVDGAQREPSGSGAHATPLPIIAAVDVAAGDAVHTFEVAKAVIAAGAAAIDVSDRLMSMESVLTGRGVLLPTMQVVRALAAVRLAADVLDVPTLIIATTTARDAALLTRADDERDETGVTAARSGEGHYVVRPSLDRTILRALAYAPFADVVCYDGAATDLEEARTFADAIRARYPDAMLAYVWPATSALGDESDPRRTALGAMGYRLHVESSPQGFNGDLPRNEATRRYVDLVLSLVDARVVDARVDRVRG